MAGAKLRFSRGQPAGWLERPGFLIRRVDEVEKDIHHA